MKKNKEQVLIEKMFKLISKYQSATEIAIYKLKIAQVSLEELKELKKEFNRIKRNKRNQLQAVINDTRTRTPSHK